MESDELNKAVMEFPIRKFRHGPIASHCVGNMDMVEVTFSDENDTNPDQLMIAESDENHESQVQVVEKSVEHVVSQEEGQTEGTVEGHIEVQCKPQDEEDTEIVEIDLMNFRLIKCDGENDASGTYKLLSPNGTERMMTIEGLHDVEGITGDNITCVLQQEEGPSTSIKYDESGTEHSKEYTVTQNEDRVPLVFYTNDADRQQYGSDHVDDDESLEKKAEILARAKMMAEKRMSQFTSGSRKRKSDLPPALELLSSPDFKLFLYSCKMCSFKCNAIKELSQHKLTHGGGSRWKGRGGRAAPALQCARCPFRAATRIQLARHSDEQHSSEESVEMMIDVYVCQACGYENSNKAAFQKHSCTVMTE